MKFQARFITKLNDGQQMQVECKEVDGKPLFSITACKIAEDRDDHCLVLKNLSIEYVKEFSRQLSNAVNFAEMK
jgi:hypothetical protein